MSVHRIVWHGFVISLTSLLDAQCLFAEFAPLPCTSTLLRSDSSCTDRIFVAVETDHIVCKGWDIDFIPREKEANEHGYSR